MVEVDRILSMLGEKRQELADQLDAIDRAIADLTSTGASVAETPSIVARPVKPRRVLSDAHKAAVSAGKRKALVAKDVAKGLAREMPDDSFVPAIGTRGDSQPPRLVKRPIKK